MKFGSLFSGIEAASVAWGPLGWQCAWVAEIDPFASAVLAHRYPDVPNLGDVNRIDADAVEPVELIVFGSPCQSFSVAGKRLGLDDPRGNMALVGLRVVGRIRPRWVIFENVPGLLSSDSGEDLKVFLDELEGLGYVIDIDILDAQYHGVPQRRRRLFVCGQLASDIQQATTPSSALTILQCLAESLALTLSVLRGRSATGSESLGFDASEPLHSLQRRMRLFGLDSSSEAVSMLEKSLAVIQASSGSGRGDLDWECGSAHTRTSRTDPAREPTRLRGSTSSRTVNIAEFPNTGTSWNGTLAAVLQVMSECITSTAPSGTTESKIFTCSRAMLVIAEHIIRSPRSSPPFWSAASSSLTALGAFIDYARQASSDLFTDLEWLQPWRDFLGEAEGLHVTLGGIGVRSFERVLLIAESLRGDSAPRREAGQNAPAGAGDGSAFSVRPNHHDAAWRGDGADNFVAFGGNRQSGPVDVATAVNAHGGPHGRLDFESETFVAQAVTADARHVHPENARGTLIAHSLRADGFDASEDGTGRGTPLIPINTQVALRHKAMGRGTGFGLGEDGDAMFTLSKCHSHAIGNAMTVRRLTPRECERLQGFPDGWTLIPYRGKPAADGPRYRSIGNSMAVPVVRWLGHRIQLFEETAASLAKGSAAA